MELNQIQRYGITENLDVLNQKIDLNLLTQNLSTVAKNRLLLNIGGYNPQIIDEFGIEYTQEQYDSHFWNTSSVPDMIYGGSKEIIGEKILYSSEVSKFEQELTNGDLARLLSSFKDTLVSDDQNTCPHYLKGYGRLDIDTLEKYCNQKRLLTRDIKLVGFDEEKINISMIYQIFGNIPVTSSGRNAWERNNQHDRIRREEYSDEKLKEKILGGVLHKKDSNYYRQCRKSKIEYNEEDVPKLEFSELKTLTQKRALMYLKFREQGLKELPQEYIDLETKRLKSLERAKTLENKLFS